MILQPSACKVIKTHEDAVSTADGTTVTLAHPVEGHYPTVRVQCEGMNGDTVTFQGSLDGETWYSVELTDIGDHTVVQTSTTSDSIWWGFVPALVYFRTSLSRVNGTVTVTVCAAS